MYPVRAVGRMVPRSDAIGKKTRDMEGLLIIACVWNEVPFLPFGTPPPSLAGPTKQPGFRVSVVVVMPEGFID